MSRTLHDIIWLTRREIMEHRRQATAAFWLGAALVVLQVLFVIAGRLHGPMPDIHVQLDGRSVLGQLAGANQTGPGRDATRVGHALAWLLYATTLLYGVAMAAAIVAYGLGCLFEERRDRSVLFWKSLPVGDGATVAAKTLFALIVLPLAWTLAGLATGWASIGVYVVAWHSAALTGGTLFVDTHLLAFTALVGAALPVYLLTLLPVVGWVMLCSASARRHPALIAFLVPALCALVGALGMANPVWHLLMGRLLPINFLQALATATQGGGLGRAVGQLWQPLGAPELWLGAALGLVFLALAAVWRARATASA